MNNIIYYNGAFLSADAVRISLWDYGWLYGDGVFEGIRVYARKIFKLNAHVLRLLRSAHAVQISTSHTIESLSDIVIETCRQNAIDDGYIRLVITRGIGPLGLNPTKCKAPTIICCPYEIKLYDPEVYSLGIRVVISSVRRTRSDMLCAQIKSLNYQNNVLAKMEAEAVGAEEAIMLNGSGYVVEGSSDNIFIVAGSVIKTPDPALGLLQGITGSVVIEIAEREGWPVQHALLTPFDVYTAEECFVTGTAAEIVPVVMVDGRRIGSGKVGPRTIAIMDRYRSITTTQGLQYE